MQTFEGDCIEEGLKKIGDGTFARCPKLTTIKLPSTVTKVGESAFNDCRNLREVVLNEGLHKIGRYAFFTCTSLAVIKLPSSGTEVGSRAFYYCTKLIELVLNERLQKIGEDAFTICPRLVVVKFPTISNRVKMLIGAGQTEIKDKITIYQHFEWRGDEFSISPEATNSQHWGTTRRYLDQLLASISYYELKEATTIIELAISKTKIEEIGAVTAEERSACRVAVREVPGLAKYAIIQYLEVDISVNGNESDDSSQYSDRSEWW